MARTISALNPESLGQAIAYLKRALQRNSNTLFLKPAQAGVELARVEVLLAKVPAKHAPEVFRTWVTENLSVEGRIKMLNALRRKKADAKPERPKRQTISLPASTLRELELLAQKTGLPMTNLLASLAAIGNVDKALRDKAVKLAVARSTR